MAGLVFFYHLYVMFSLAIFVSIYIYIYIYRERERDLSCYIIFSFIITTLFRFVITKSYRLFQLIYDLRACFIYSFVYASYIISFELGAGHVAGLSNT